MRIICCRFGDKFNDWHVKNLKYMIDNYSDKQLWIDSLLNIYNI